MRQNIKHTLNSQQTLTGELLGVFCKDFVEN